MSKGHPLGTAALTLRKHTSTSLLKIWTVNRAYPTASRAKSTGECRACPAVWTRRGDDLGDSRFIDAKRMMAHLHLSSSSLFILSINKFKKRKKQEKAPPYCDDVLLLKVFHIPNRMRRVMVLSFHYFKNYIYFANERLPSLFIPLEFPP